MKEKKLFKKGDPLAKKAGSKGGETTVKKYGTHEMAKRGAKGLATRWGKKLDKVNESVSIAELGKTN